MKKTFLVFAYVALCCFVLYPTVNAAEKFSPGYVITLSNDTLKGYIQSYNVNLFKKCQFKKELSSVVKEYSPGEINSFRFSNGGKFYISKKTPTDEGNKILFLEFLVKGKASMYFYKDDVDHFYVETDKSGIVELSQRPQIINRADGTKQFKQELYTGKLKAVMSDCVDLFSEIDKSYLSHSDMVKITKAYNDRVCTSEQCTVFEQKIKPVRITISIIGGLAVNNFKYCSVSTDSKTNPLLGCRLNFDNMFFSSELITFQTGLLLQRYGSYKLKFDPNVYTIWYKSEDKYDYIFINQSNNIIPTTLNSIAIKVPIAISYTFSHAKLAPYVGGGIMNTFTNCKNSDFYRSRYGTPQHFPSYQLGVTGLLGLKYKTPAKHNLFAEVSYEYSKDLQSVDGYNSTKNYNLAFLVGYTF